MSVTTAKRPRRKFRFADRETAEREYLNADQDRLRAYFVACWFRAGLLPAARFVRGDYSAEVITHHPTNGRALSIGPIAIVADHSGDFGGLPEIVDAFDWAHGIKCANVTPCDQTGYDYRELAHDVWQFITAE